MFDLKIIEHELLSVQKPGRYIGGEPHAIQKDPDAVDVWIALFFPDVYELGTSYQGFHILYHLLNREPFIAAERVFSPWPDFEAVLRKHGLALYSLESKRPLREFDIVGITLQYELHASNILNGLDLGGIPVFAAERTDADPLVIGGGPNAANPEPLADFFDAFVIGDGERAALEIAGIVRDAKRGRWKRQQLLRRLASIPGVYVPSLYEATYDAAGRFRAIRPRVSEAALPVEGRIEPLDEKNYPTRLVLPLLRTTHDRLSVEVMRGCTRGCRFCHAGYYYRPSRERRADQLAGYIRETVLANGYDEVSLASLSTSDYSQLPELWERIRPFFDQYRVSLAMPSLRPETITPELIQALGREKKSGLTIAPEAGTPRLRRVINKIMDEEVIFRAVRTAFEHGWKLVKLYFMIGLPTETEEDLLGLADLVNRIGRIARKYGAKVKVSISPFNPKAHTPFQWAAQDDISVLEEKIGIVARNIRGRHIELTWRNPEVTRLEGIIARGDRRLGRAIYEAWKLGARFDAWTDQFSWDIWKKAFAKAGIQPEEYTRARELDEPLPWNHISRGVTRDFLRKEWERALQEQGLEDCKYASCNLCGLMKQPECRQILKRSKKQGPARDGHPVFRWKRREEEGLEERDTKQPVVYVRLRYAKQGWMRFIGHLDLTSLMLRLFRIARLPFVFTEGFSPHPKVSFGPPIPLGVESVWELMDLHLYRDDFGALAARLNALMPDGLRIEEVQISDAPLPPLREWIQEAQYQIWLPGEISAIQAAVEQVSSGQPMWLEKETRKGKKRVNLASIFISVNYWPQRKLLQIRHRVENGQPLNIFDILACLTRGESEIVSRCRIVRSYMGPTAVPHPHETTLAGLQVV